ncbi:MAG: CRISPR-associated helicase Cas3', partial [bacterium]
YNINLSEKDWIILKLSTIYHDLGKINSYFQNKIKKQPIKLNLNYPHNFLSTFFINKNLITNFLDAESYKIIFYIVAFHHDRQINISTINEQNIKIILSDLSLNLKKINLNTVLDNELLLDLKEIFKNDYYDIIKLISNELEAIKILQDIKNIQNKNLILRNINTEINKVKLLGLFLRLDHSSSAKINVEQNYINKSQIITDYLNKLKTKWQLDYYNPKLIDKNVLILASTGLGKTEASLLLSGNYKLFYTLPTTSTVDAIYKRFIQYFNINNVGILHNNSYNTIEYILQSSKNNKSIDTDEYDLNLYLEYNLSKNLSKHITVLTVDQIFTSYLKYYGYQKIYSTLSYSKLIIDEIQAYSPLILAIILNTLKEINNLGGKYIILTATLPKFLENYLSFEYQIKYIPNITKHKIKIINDQITQDNEVHPEILNKILSKKYKKILIICNTVSKAQEIYYKLIQNEKIKKEVNNIILLHSRFIKLDRVKKEEIILNKDFQGILVSTQVVEVSLDIDFDILFTELAPLDVIIQRAGRILRKYKFNLDKTIDTENIIIFAQNPSGKGVIYETELLNNTLDILNQLKNNNLLSETLKIKLIEDYYNINNLKYTNYYQKFKTYYDKIDSIFVDKKSQAHEIFREDIRNIDFIPLKILEKNITKIKESILSNYKENNKLNNKLKILDTINDISLTIPFYFIKKYTSNLVIYKLGDVLNYRYNLKLDDLLHRFFNNFITIDLNYDFELGIDLKNISELSGIESCI